MAPFIFQPSPQTPLKTTLYVPFFCYLFSRCYLFLILFIRHSGLADKQVQKYQQVCEIPTHFCMLWPHLLYRQNTAHLKMLYLLPISLLRYEMTQCISKFV